MVRLDRYEENKQNDGEDTAGSDQLRGAGLLKNKKTNKNGKKQHALTRVLWGAAGAVILIVAVGFAVFFMARFTGRRSLMAQTDQEAPDLSLAVSANGIEEATEQEKNVWQEDWVKYNGRIYTYNKDIMTFLIMGIDKKSDAVEVAEGQNGGQADALFLVVADPHEKEIKIISINRNTMAMIDFYDENGVYKTTGLGQICVQHGFGNGVEESCEYQKKAVRSLFYGLPIHGYAAVNMSAISTINDAVGGVDVVVLDDVTAKDKTLVKGNAVHLMGESAFWYVKYRDIGIFGSADMRLERQKQYLKAFVAKTKEAVKKDPSVALTLYNDIRAQMVTDISADEVVYLASTLIDYRFEEGNLYSLKGETVKGEKYEEFYADEDALYQMIIEVFYEEVEPEENGT